MQENSTSYLTKSGIPARRALTLVAVALVYIIAGKLGLRLAFVHQSATAVWPPAGIALAAMLSLGPWVWPSVLVGAFVVNLTTAGTIWTSLGIGVGNTLEAVTGSLLVNRFARGRDAFIRPQDVFRFALLGGLCSTSVAATIGVTVLCLGGLAAWATAGPIWLTWWLGDGVGDVLLTPGLLLWARRWPVGQRRLPETLFLTGILFVVGMIVFGGWIPWRRADYPLEFTVTPILLWGAFRFGPRVSTSMMVLLAGIALWGTLHGYGPFVTSSPNESLLLLQSYLGVSAVTVLAVSGVVRERTQVREQLESQARELARSNADLEQFAYIASHDLQEPLRITGSFAHLLATRYRTQLDREADEYIDFITSGVDRMAALIEGILLYSRVAISDRSAGNADASSALTEALANLSGMIDENNAAITHDTLPTVCIDQSQLTMVFQNLISNAIKYRSNEVPRVHVSAVQKGGEWIFSVTDNGIGIEPQYRKQVFVLFKRLHGTEVPGAGIGLALCKKIIEWHGGQIWIAPKPECGAQLCFSLRAKGQEIRVP